jgi:Spy/CpxP family protein refolding chaperone
MKRTLSAAAVGGLTLALLLLPQLYGQEAKTTKTDAKPAAAAKKADAPAKAKGRLPNYYGKLELSPEQRDKIYSIQALYQTQIDEAEAKLAELKSKQDAEVSAVLTKEQREKFDELVQAAKKKKEEAKQKTAAPAKPAAAATPAAPATNQK